LRNLQLLLSDIFQFAPAMAKTKGPIETEALFSVFEVQLASSLEAKLQGFIKQLFAVEQNRAQILRQLGARKSGVQGEVLKGLKGIVGGLGGAEEIG